MWAAWARWKERVLKRKHRVFLGMVAEENPDLPPSHSRKPRKRPRRLWPFLKWGVLK